MGTMKSFDIDLFPSVLEFSVFTGEEIKRLSVVKIITGLTFDPIGHPLPGGLYDSRMGPFGKRMEPCTTCFNIQACPGHLGHIELNAIVYNPFFIKLVQKICRVFCGNCYKIQKKDHEVEILVLQLRLIDAGYIVEAQELEFYKSEVVLANTETFVKQENGNNIHPRIAEMYQILMKNQVEVNVTKTSCALRSAVVNAALQRPETKLCGYCKKPLRNIRYLYRKLVYFMGISEVKNKFKDIEEPSGQYKVILADECRRLLRQVYQIYPELMQLLFPILKFHTDSSSGDSSPVDIFFMDTIPVTPPKSRPSNILNNQIVEHAQTGLYRNIIENNSVLRVVLKHIKGQIDELSSEAQDVFASVKGESAYERLYNAWQSLQMSINVLLDVNMSSEVTPSTGLKQILEKKDGLIRKHMMGKRVNYAARTVITPDPNINVDEVGIPDIFAKKLSYPVPVTPWNVAELRKMVMNGPNIHPGANYIQDERGYTTLIPADNAAKRESMAKMLFNYPEKGIKIVHRHVLNGDILLLNRQPSLHKLSIMAHKARILQGEKTFRLHYSNCKAYNADFDGDEMNAHLPQSEVARSEAYNLVNVSNNYLVPKDGTPLGGLIQDHIISGVKLSIRGRFFNRDDYHQLVFQGLSHIRNNIKLLPPTIIKPLNLWSGKQIFSTLLINLIPEGHTPISLNSVAKIAAKDWMVSKNRTFAEGSQLNDTQMSESEVIIKNGELLVGVLDKQQYGATTYGLIHCMYELYGGDVSTCLLTAFTKVFTFFLQREGFTLGVKDILVTREADSQRSKIVQESRGIGNAALASALDLESVPSLDVLSEEMEEAYIKDPKFRIILDRKYKNILDNYTNSVNKICLPHGLITMFPSNNLQLMVLSGAKGSIVNTMQISCMLGQIELEGKRPPLMISGKSLPSFTSFETSPKSGGYIDGRFLTGIQPQDFFFHCMAGREGLIDTAVKTSRSGYLQRCLIKHLEGLTINYDLTVRDSDNTVIQYLYGEDGLDILKSKFFDNKFGTSFLMQNASTILRPLELELIRNEEDLLKVQRHNKKLRSWKKKHKSFSMCKAKHISPFTQFSAELQKEIEVENGNDINEKTGRRRIDEAKIKLWYKADDDSKRLFQKKYGHCPDPTNSILSQDSTFGSVSEKIEQILVDYIEKHPNKKDTSADVMYVKNVKALAAPGEPVGLLAAQSIGEPSTQMTLNTFHFAGRGEMNVTLGIPRLREILMMASANIKTPSMDIPIKPSQENAAEKLRISLNRVTLADVLQYVQVKSQLVQQPIKAQKYELTFQFLPREIYGDEFCVKPKRILKFLSSKFFSLLFGAIIKSKKSKENLIVMGDTQKEDSNNDEKLDDDDCENGSNKKSKKSKSEVSNDDNRNDSSDEELDNNDGDDVSTIKLKTSKVDETEYDDPDDVDELKDADVDEDLSDDGIFLTESIEDNGKETENGKNDGQIEKILDNAMVESYYYDKKHHLWAKLTFNLDLKYRQPNISSIIKDLAQKSVIHQVDNIKRAIIYKGNKDDMILKTDGINIAEMCKHNTYVDINRLYTNDIHAISRTYGIEAAAQVIIQEVTNVFKVYGITINRRHLSLIADYMTFDGTFQPLSRKGMEHSSSPLQQMSFESCLQFLRNAAGAGYGDELNSPSSRLMVGLPVRNGTGAFELLSKIC